MNVHVNNDEINQVRQLRHTQANHDDEKVIHSRI